MLDQEYTPADIEQKWYEFWLEKKFFHASIDDKKTSEVPRPMLFLLSANPFAVSNGAK